MTIIKNGLKKTIMGIISLFIILAMSTPNYALATEIEQLVKIEPITVEYNVATGAYSETVGRIKGYFDDTRELRRVKKTWTLIKLGDEYSEIRLPNKVFMIEERFNEFKFKPVQKLEDWIRENFTRSVFDFYQEERIEIKAEMMIFYGPPDFPEYSPHWVSDIVRVADIKIIND